MNSFKDHALLQYCYNILDMEFLTVWFTFSLHIQRDCGRNNFHSCLVYRHIYLLPRSFSSINRCFVCVIEVAAVVFFPIMHMSNDKVIYIHYDMAHYSGRIMTWHTAIEQLWHMAHCSGTIMTWHTAIEQLCHMAHCSGAIMTWHTAIAQLCHMAHCSGTIMTWHTVKSG